jgi:hypothetical protein
VSAEADQESDTRDAKENKIEGFMFSGDERHYHEKSRQRLLKTIGLIADAAFVKTSVSGILG